MGNPESKPAQQWVCNRKSVMSQSNGVYVYRLCINFKLYIIAYLIHVVENSLWVWESLTSACTALSIHFIHYINIFLFHSMRQEVDFVLNSTHVQIIIYSLQRKPFSAMNAL